MISRVASCQVTTGSLDMGSSFNDLSLKCVPNRRLYHHSASRAPIIAGLCQQAAESPQFGACNFPDLAGLAISLMR
jgi:hypothetical protein